MNTKQLRKETLRNISNQFISNLKAEKQCTKHQVKKEYFEEEDDIKKECRVDNEEVISSKHEYFEECMKREGNENSDNQQ